MNFRLPSCPNVREVGWCTIACTDRNKMVKFCAVDRTKPVPVVVVTDIVPPPTIHRIAVGSYNIKFVFPVKCLVGTSQLSGPAGDVGETILTSSFDSQNQTSWFIHTPPPATLPLARSLTHTSASWLIKNLPKFSTSALEILARGDPAPLSRRPPRPH